MSNYQAHQVQGIRLNANECPFDCETAMVKTLADRIQQASLNRYPDDLAGELAEKAAALYGVAPDELMVVNGSDAALQLLISAKCRNGKGLVMLNPDFEMYRFYADAIQAPVYTLQTDWAGNFDWKELAGFAAASDAGLVLLSNPNNPTGHLTSREDIDHLAAALEKEGIFLGVDEAYMDFDDQSALPLLKAHPNLAVTRTLSKAWGMAGIRIGFLIACLPTLQELAPWRIVYSVSTPDQLAALAALEHPRTYQRYLNLVAAERERLKKALEKIPGLETGPFHGNFYALRAHNHPEKLEEAFEQAGIAVRAWNHHQRIRITIGTPEQNDQVLAVLKKWKEAS